MPVVDFDGFCEPITQYKHLTGKLTLATNSIFLGKQPLGVRPRRTPFVEMPL
jgi:hypothetical protein